MSAVAVPNIWEEICKEFASRRPPFEPYVPPPTFNQPDPSQVPLTAASTVRFEHTTPQAPTGGTGTKSATDTHAQTPTKDGATEQVAGDGAIRPQTQGVDAGGGLTTQQTPTDDQTAHNATSQPVEPDAADKAASTEADATAELVPETKIVIQSPSCGEMSEINSSRKTLTSSREHSKESLTAQPTEEQPQKELPPLKTCLPADYLNSYIFPVLLPAMEAMLRAAETKNCFIWKRVNFNPLDFLTEYLYNHNQEHERDHCELKDIPFVAEHWKEHPRPPLPKSLVWTEEESTLIIQSYWRGYQIRKREDVQELRTWQKDWREENESIHNKVDEFWSKRMPEGGDEGGGVGDNGGSGAPEQQKVPEEGGGAQKDEEEVKDVAGEPKIVPEVNIPEGENEAEGVTARHAAAT